MPDPATSLRGATPGTLRAGITRFGDRSVVLARFEDPASELSESEFADLAAATEQALAARLPLVLALQSSGPHPAEGLGALESWGRAARAITRCSGVVPVLAAVTGPMVTAAALLVGLADHAVFTNRAHAYVSGPQPVRAMTGVRVSAEELGGAAAHDRASGVASLVVPDEDAAYTAIESILLHLPDHVDRLADPVPTDDPADRPTPEAGQVMPATSTGGYDVRDVIRAICDDGEMLEVRANWAPNLVTAYSSIAGRPVGIVANQPIAVAGTLDIAASQKGARFVASCDAFNLPLLTLVDTPGFYPGKDLEWRGMIRKGAQLAFAYARATVPRVALVLRKSYGGAYIVMDSKTMGNDVYLAWPSAEIAVMGAAQAAQILYRRNTPEERLELQADYEARLLNPYAAAERGLIDGVVTPADTRAVLADTFEMLATRREHLPSRRHDNTPL